MDLYNCDLPLGSILETVFNYFGIILSSLILHRVFNDFGMDCDLMFDVFVDTFFPITHSTCKTSENHVVDNELICFTLQKNVFL